MQPRHIKALKLEVSALDDLNGFVRDHAIYFLVAIIWLMVVLLAWVLGGGLGALAVKGLRRHACEIYHRHCQEAGPESTFEANMDLMFSHLPGPARTNWHRWI